jgi:NDP-sugar pyrophosphorylase family protein
MKAFILAAGEGSRMRPLTLDRPKPMLEIQGKPLLEHIICWLRHHGITQIAMNLHYKADTITECFSDGRHHGVQLIYSREDRILGTSGALKKIESWLSETFVVIYGDVLTNVNLRRVLDFHSRAAGAPCRVTSVVYQVPNPTECGIVEVDADNRIMRLIEKPAPEQVFSTLALAGVLVMEPGVLSYVAPDTFHDIGHDLLPALMDDGWCVYGTTLTSDERVVDIGTPQKYAAVRNKGLQ